MRGDILPGNLKAGEKLPSKRALADNLEISKARFSDQRHGNRIRSRP